MPILQSQIICFSWIYAFLAWLWPNSNNNNVKLYRVLYFLNCTFFLSLHFIFSALTMKISLILYFPAQFSQFLIWDNIPPSLLPVTNSSVWKYVSSGWCLAESYLSAHHVTSPWARAHEQIFSPSRSKQLPETGICTCCMVQTSIWD
jgi:hypothetical protein